jgi:hypothetical protein
MAHLTLLPPSPTSTLRSALAQDIRNAMAVFALHIEMPEGLAGPPGVKAASAAHQLLMKVTAICDDFLRERAIEFSAPRRTSVDIVETIRQVIDILRPITPVGLKIKFHPDILRGMCGGGRRFWPSTPPPSTSCFQPISCRRI